MFHQPPHTHSSTYSSSSSSPTPSSPSSSNSLNLPSDPLELDSFLAQHANQPELALPSLIDRFNHLTLQLAHIKKHHQQLQQPKQQLKQQQQQLNSSIANQADQRVKQLQEENRQLWALISKSKAELNQLKLENKELRLKLDTNSTTTTTTTRPSHHRTPSSKANASSSSLENIDFLLNHNQSSSISSISDKTRFKHRKSQIILSSHKFNHPATHTPSHTPIPTPTTPNSLEQPPHPTLPPPPPPPLPHPPSQLHFLQQQHPIPPSRLSNSNPDSSKNPIPVPVNPSPSSAQLTSLSSGLSSLSNSIFAPPSSSTFHPSIDSSSQLNQPKPPLSFRDQPKKSPSLKSTHDLPAPCEEEEEEPPPPSSSQPPSFSSPPKKKASSIDLFNEPTSSADISISHSVSAPTLIDSSIPSLGSSPTKHPSDHLPHNAFHKPQPTSMHNNSNKFRLSLHPTTKQSPSRQFHRHSVVPPEVRQYVTGLLPPLTPTTMSALPMPPTRSTSAPSENTPFEIHSTSKTPAPVVKTESVESPLIVSHESGSLTDSLKPLDPHPHSTESQSPLSKNSLADTLSLTISDSSSNLNSSSPTPTNNKSSWSNMSPTSVSHHHNLLPGSTNTHGSSTHGSSTHGSSSQHLPLPTTPANSAFPHSTQPTTKRRMLTPTFLPFTQIKVTNSHIRANDKSKDVISFSININIVIPPESDPERKGAKASWVVEKFYSDVLALDHLVKSKHSKSQNKALAQLPDRALFKDHAPSKVDARKAVLQKYLQSLCGAQLKENGDVCDFFNSNIVVTERASAPSRPGFMQGYLTKKGRNFGGWQTRFYILDGPILEYFDTRGGNRLGHIVITGAQIGRQQPRPQEAHDDSYRHAFLIRMHKRDKESEIDHILCAETDEERDAWVDALTCYVSGRYVSTDLIAPSPDSTPSRPVNNNGNTSHPSFSEERPGRQTSLDGASRSDGPHLSMHHRTSSSDFRSSPSSTKPPRPPAHSRAESLNSSLTATHPEHSGGMASTPTILEEPGLSDKRKTSTDQQHGPATTPDHRDRTVSSSTQLENRPNAVDSRNNHSTTSNHNPQQQPLQQPTTPVPPLPLTPRPNIQAARHLQHAAIHGSPSQQDQTFGSDADSIITSSNDRPQTPDSSSQQQQQHQASHHNPNQRPKISGPMNGAPITGGYRIKPIPEDSSNNKKAKFRSAFWGFAGRNLTADRKDIREGGNNSSTAGSSALFSPAPRPVFGVSLQEAVSVARVHDGLDLPAVVFRCIEFLEAKGAIEEEGIYRLSGSSVIIKGYKERFNTEGDFNLLESSKFEYHDVHAVAGLLKQFLRELASPILTKELHPEFLKVIDLSQRSDKVNELGRLCTELPISNYTLLRFLSAHLIHVVQNEKVNKMSLRNVGIVFSPTLGMPAPLFALLLKEFDLIFNIEGDSPAPIKLPDESSLLPPPSINNNNSSSGSSSSSNNNNNNNSMIRPVSSLVSSSNSHKRISRNSMLYSATGADTLMEHNKLTRSKENISEDSDSDVDYDSSSEPDEEILGASIRAASKYESTSTLIKPQQTTPSSVESSVDPQLPSSTLNHNNKNNGLNSSQKQHNNYQVKSGLVGSPSLVDPLNLSSSNSSSNSQFIHHHHLDLHSSQIHSPSSASRPNTQSSNLSAASTVRPRTAG